MNQKDSNRVGSRLAFREAFPKAIMPFGRYRGSRLKQIPNDYLQWLLKLPDLRETLRLAVTDELQRRTERTAIWNSLREGIAAEIVNDATKPDSENTESRKVVDLRVWKSVHVIRPRHCAG